MPASLDFSPIGAVILAGGQSRRMAGLNKSELRLAGQWLLDLIIARLRPQVTQILVNLNTPIAGPNLAGCQVVVDVVPDFPGPLTGLASALAHWRNNPQPPEMILLVPCDGPFVPANLVEKLLAALIAQNADVACARYEGEAQPTFSLWRYGCGAAVHKELAEGKGGFKGLLRALHTVYVDWPTAPVNPFFNINTPDELRLAEQLWEASCP